ncbi:MAG: hypothetical protein RBT63_07435, partial [Bdellovibrionales bacterium]|nr:hypothetical protein [Bdellovibrionales bacterium]
MRSKITIFAVGLSLAISVLTIISWQVDFPILRTFLPGFPGMIPMTAFVLSIIALTLLLSLMSSRYEPSPTEDPTGKPRTKKAAIILATFINFCALGTLVSYLFSYEASFNLNFIFTDPAHPQNMRSGGNMSVQTAMSAFFLATSILIHLFLTIAESRVSPKVTRVLVIIMQSLPLLTLGICCLAAIGY